MKSPGAPPAFASSSITRQAIHTPHLSSKHFDTAIPSPKRSKPTPKVMGSPTDTSFFTRLGFMPRSITSDESGVTFLRSSSSMRWMGLRPTTPRSTPLAVCTSTRMPGRMAASTPPSEATDRKPSSEM